MKRNVMMRLASFLLVAVLISTSAISGTYAKYVTEGKAKDYARVAKFGVVIDMEGDSMFKNEYATDDTTNYSGALSVKAENESLLVAPGTKSDENTSAKFSISGKPEVATKVDVKFENVEDIVLKAGTYKNPTTAEDDTFTLKENYYPVVFTLKQTAGEGPEYKGTLKELEAALETWAKTAKYAPNTDLAASVELSWEWRFNGNDAADTVLGNLMAGVNPEEIPAEKYNLEIAYDLTITVTQID